MMRDVLVFNNLMSQEDLLQDPSGMLSPSYDRWSLEFWVRLGKDLFVPSECMGHIVQQRDIVTTVIGTVWEEKQFVARQNVYGAKSAVDEAVVTLDVTLKSRSDAMVYLCVRPYNTTLLGGVNSAAYSADEGTISINGHRSIYCPMKPDLCLAGKGDRDVNIREEEDSFQSRSSLGMAALAMGFRLKKGENCVHFRCSLSPRGFKAGKYDLDSVRQDFTRFGSMRIKEGASLTMTDREMQNWFGACKMNSLLFTGSDRNVRQDMLGYLDYRRLYFAVQGFNRIGYFKEADAIVEELRDRYPTGEKKPGFWSVISGCYLLCAYSDIFTHTRDTDYLQSHFPQIKQVAQILLKAAGGVKGLFMNDINSIPEYCIREGHPVDTLLLSDALERFSYLARCLGLFGDEIRYRKEADRLLGLFTDAIESGAYRLDSANYIFYLLHQIVQRPFPEATTKAIVDAIFRRYGDMPLNVKPYGWDVFHTLVVANALILLRDGRAHQVLRRLMEVGGGRFSLPSYLSPATGRGCYGSGSSKISCLMLFTCLRNLLFVDYPERLEIFPVPQRDWCKPGAEMSVDALPSRFGLISFRVVSTSNEIQFHFDALPKFVPPDIMINLPVKVAIQEGDDFIIKREDEQSFVINGWPSVIRFIRK
ncbi:MAG: hypothetical protein JXA20_15140 [Spirochaetes bacterium]|nr:hypothetical protein [Spirochaetota bacterium]